MAQDRPQQFTFSVGARTGKPPDEAKDIGLGFALHGGMRFRCCSWPKIDGTPLIQTAALELGFSDALSEVDFVGGQTFVTRYQQMSARLLARTLPEPAGRTTLQLYFGSALVYSRYGLTLKTDSYRTPGSAITGALIAGVDVYPSRPSWLKLYGECAVGFGNHRQPVAVELGASLLMQAL